MAAQGLVEPFQHTEGVVATIDGFPCGSNMALPTGGHDLHRRLRKIRVFLPFQVTQERESFEYRFAGLVAGKLDGAQEGREKPVHRGIARHDFLVVVVIGWACQLVNGGDRLGDLGLFFAEKRPYLFISPPRSDDLLADLCQ
jgi:hypothetical protein